MCQGQNSRKNHCSRFRRPALYWLQRQYCYSFTIYWLLGGDNLMSRSIYIFLFYLEILLRMDIELFSNGLFWILEMNIKFFFRSVYCGKLYWWSHNVGPRLVFPETQLTEPGSRCCCDVTSIQAQRASSSSAWPECQCYFGLPVEAHLNLLCPETVGFLCSLNIWNYLPGNPPGPGA